MFIKVTLARLDKDDKEISVSRLLNHDDIKSFGAEPDGKLYVYYKTYNDINEESDQLKEDVPTIVARLKSAGLYNPEPITSITK